MKLGSGIEAQEQTRPKIIQIFRYLQALNQVRNPPQRNFDPQAWTLWFHDLPIHPCICALSTYGETMIHTSPTTVPSVTCRSQQPATGKLNPVPYSAPGWYQFEPLCLARKKGRTRSP